MCSISPYEYDLAMSWPAQMGAKKHLPLSSSQTLPSNFANCLSVTVEAGGPSCFANSKTVESSTLDPLFAITVASALVKSNRSMNGENCGASGPRLANSRFGASFARKKTLDSFSVLA